MTSTLSTLSTNVHAVLSHEQTCLALTGQQRVLHQHRDSHGADTTGNGCYSTRFGGDFVKRNIPDHPITLPRCWIVDTVNSDVDHDDALIAADALGRPLREVLMLAEAAARQAT